MSQVTVTMSAKQVARLSLIPRFVLPFTKRTAWIVIALTLVLLIALTEFADEPIIRETDPIRFMLAFFGMFGSWLFMEYLGHQRLAVASGIDDLPITYKIGGEGLIYVIEGREGTIAWSKFGQGLHFKKWLFLEYGRGHLIFPQSAFGSHAEFESFVQEITGRLTIARRQPPS
jgi:hypothetical protein